jgi:feruloyl-CoA synthase
MQFSHDQSEATTQGRSTRLAVELAPMKPVVDRPAALKLTHLPSGVIKLAHPDPLIWEEHSLPDRLRNQGKRFGERLALGQNSGSQASELSFASASDLMDMVAGGVEKLGLSHGNKIAIIAKNSIDHAVLMFGALALGLVVIPLSPMALAQASGFEAILKLLKRVGADAIAADGAVLERLFPVCSASTLFISLDGDTKFVTMTELKAGPKLETPAKLSADDWAKIHFTSGSTGDPKGVICTHGMLASVAAMQSQLFSSDEDPDVTVDWMPWHHTYGGNVILNGALWRGDSLWIDDGLPIPGHFERTVANLSRRQPTAFAGVPASFSLLLERLEHDEGFATSFFARLKFMSSGGAGLSPSVAQRIQQAAVRACGYRIPFGSGYGLTEAGGLATLTYWLNDEPSTIGLPLPGVRIKLVPIDGQRYELFVKGPNVTLGYYNDQVATSSAFDEEGYFKTGDCVHWFDPANPKAGLCFAGRLSEEFKLSNGTFVRASQLSTALTDHLGAPVRDVVLVGENQAEVGALIWIDPSVTTDEALHAKLDARIKSFNAVESASTRRIGRWAILAPPSANLGEIAEKGSLNRTVVRRNRSIEIEKLFA